MVGHFEEYICNKMSSFVKPLMLAYVLVWVIQDIGARLQNVGLYKTAAQSSTAVGGVASRAVDGNTGSNYISQLSCTHTFDGGSFDPWWKVDLGQYYLVERTILYNRQECCQRKTNLYNNDSPDSAPSVNMGTRACSATPDAINAERLRNVQVGYSNVDSDYKSFGFHQGQVGIKTTIFADESKLRVYNSLIARWIKINLEGRTILTLCEVKVMSGYTMRKFDFDGTALDKEETTRVGGNRVPLRLVIQCFQACSRTEKSYFMRLNNESPSSLYLECYCPL